MANSGSVLIKLLQYLLKIIKGMFLGLAMIIPGVSISTFAVIFGEYDLMLETLSLNLKVIKSRLGDIISLGIGLILGFFLTVELLTFLFDHYEVYTIYFFIGMMAGSLPWLWINDVKAKKEGGCFKLSSLAGGIIALAAMIAMRFANFHDGSAMEQLNFLYGLLLFASGFAGAVAMVLPGISGSSSLIILGTYTTMLAAVKNFNLPIIAIFAAGAVAGLIISGKLFKWLIARFPEQMSLIIFALVIGSVIAIIPSDFGNSNILLCAVFFLAAAAVTWSIPIVSDKIKAKFNMQNNTSPQQEISADISGNSETDFHKDGDNISNEADK